MKYNKLVRDKIPRHIIENNGIPKIHIANMEEYWQKLKEKLTEEVEEFKKNETIEEFADILEVIDAIGNYKKFRRDEVKNIKKKKAAEKGKFKDRIILDEVL